MSESNAPRNELGKRYRCAACGSEVLCLKAGDGRFECHNQVMTPVQQAPVPSSD